MTFDPEAGELLPDGSRIGETTAGELADWLAEHPPEPCGCADPQLWNLCCPAKLIYPAYAKPQIQRGAGRKGRGRRYL